MTSHKGVSNIVLIIILAVLVVALIGLIFAFKGSPTTNPRTNNGTSTPLTAEEADVQIKAVLATAPIATQKVFAEKGVYTDMCTDKDVFAVLTRTADLSNYKVICTGAERAWAIEAKLKTGGYWCVDSTGSAVALDKEIGNANSCR